MRHRPHALRHDLRHLAGPLGRLRRNVTFIAVSLLVPLVGLGALAVPPRLLQGVAAPLWNATASPLAELVTAQTPRPLQDASASLSRSEQKRGHRVQAGNASGAGAAVNGRGRISRGPGADRPIGAPSQNEPSASGGVLPTEDNEATADTVPSGGDAERAEDARDGERARPVTDKSGGGAGSGSGRDNDRPALTTVPAKMLGAAKAAVAQAGAAIVDTTAAPAAAKSAAGPGLPGDTKEVVAAVVAVATVEAPLSGGVLQASKAGER